MERHGEGPGIGIVKTSGVARYQGDYIPREVFTAYDENVEHDNCLDLTKIKC